MTDAGIHADDAANLVVAMMAFGLAASFFLADRRSPTSRALAAALSWVAVAVALNVLVAAPMHARHELPAWDGIFALPETLAMLCALEWFRRLLRTSASPTPSPGRRLRLAEGCVVLYGLLALALPEWRSHQFINVFRHDQSHYMHPPDVATFMVFAGPLLVAFGMAILAGLRALGSQPDPAEVRRGVAFLAGAPFLGLAMVLPVHVAPFSAGLGVLLFLSGALQYHVAQGARAQFLSRFLSPHVARLVEQRGLASVLDMRTIDITVVCCDLRGFTAYTAASSPERVIDILRDYYDIVGEAVAEQGGTIKDQAGDGVLVLVGAPIEVADHAHRGLALALTIRQRGHALIQRWSTPELRLGLGVGVASGAVAVGAIGHKSRLEYTAVGSPVNLAARLCSEATDGEILVAPHTADSVAGTTIASRLSTGRALQLKGFAAPVVTWALSAGDDVAAMRMNEKAGAAKRDRKSPYDHVTEQES